MSSLTMLQDKDYANKEYEKLREKMGQQQTKTQWNRLVDAAAMFLLNCHPDLTTGAQALCLELTMREKYMKFLPEEKD